MVADELQAVRDTLADCHDAAERLLGGPGVPAEVRGRARHWMRLLDRAVGTERTCTIDDTITELRAAGVPAT
jgi:hypothetical protein